MAENNGNESGNGQNVGRVESVTGVVVDALFDDELPEIYSALEIKVPRARANATPAMRPDAARSSSTSATTACARSRWTPPTASSAATR